MTPNAAVPGAELRTRYTVLCVAKAREWEVEDIQALLLPELERAGFAAQRTMQHWRTMAIEHPETTTYRTWCDGVPPSEVADHDHIVVMIDGMQMPLERVPGDAAR